MKHTHVKKIVIIVLGCILALAAGRVACGQELKVAYIDLAKTFDEYQKTKEYDKSLETKGDQKEKEREKLVNDIKSLKEEIVLLNDKAKQEKQAVIDDKIKSLQDFDQGARDELKQERDNMVRDILGEIDKVIKDYGKKNGYTLIFNDRVLVYGADSINITQDIIDILNKNYKKKN